MSSESEAHEQGEGENYFVSMTDMMVGIIFMFIIMLMSFALAFQQRTDEQKDKTKEQEGKIVIAEAIGRKLDDLEQQISTRLQEMREASALRLRLLREIEGDLKSAQINVILTETGDVLRLDDSAIRFELNRAELSEDAQAKVSKIASVLAHVLPRYLPCSSQPAAGCRSKTEASVETVFIEGHTDETGDDESNWTLSTARAANTFRTLTQTAPELRRLRNRSADEILSISGYASTRRVDSAGTPGARAKNRRIDLRFVMDTDPRAGLTEIDTLLNDMRSEISLLKRPRP
jgi:flagellar motor protein MotB